MYNVIITGELLDGQEKSVVLARFAKAFKLSDEKAEQLFSSAPAVIKKNADEAMAKKMAGVLGSIGLGYRLEEQASPVAVVERIVDEKGEEAPAPVQPETFQGYTFKLEGQPDYSFVTVQVPANETLKVEASAMATMDTNMVMKTKAKGGVGRLFSGESIFINEFTAEHGAAEIGIAAGAPGDLKHVYLDDEIIYLQNSAFVASAMNVVTETKWQGLTKGFFSGESLFLIRCSGTGDLWFNTYGAMIEIDVEEDYVVDTGNIVAFTSGLDYNITKVGGYKSLFFSGEGFVCRFSGKGKVWIQTRGVDAFTSWAHWYRPVKKKG